MTGKQRGMLIAAAVAAAALGAATGYYVKRHLVKPEVVEQQGNVGRTGILPAFTLFDMNGNPVTKEDLLANDKALFINFWATWCKPCREEMPLLAEMQEKYADDLLMVGIAIDNHEAVAKFLEHIGGVNYPILLGRQELDAIETANAMGIDLIGLPVSLMTDRTGTIVAIHTGQVDAAEATALIETAMQPASRK